MKNHASTAAGIHAAAGAARLRDGSGICVGSWQIGITVASASMDRPIVVPADSTFRHRRLEEPSP